MRSFEVLSALLVSATVVQAITISISISGDNVCETNSGCAGVLLDVASDTDFSLLCDALGSCEGTHIVVHSDCTLRPGGIQCTKKWSCMDATIAVDNSNLATDADNYLNCDSSFAGVCTNLAMTLVDSSIALLCGSDDCDNMQVHLFGSSTLELKTDSVITTDSSKALTIYVYDSSQLIDNGVSGYNLVTEAPTTSTTTTTTSTTPKPTVPTSTRAPIIPSTSTISTPIISTVQTTTKPNTIASTTLKPTITPTIPTPTTPTVPITTTATPTPIIPTISTRTPTNPSNIPATTNTPNTQTTASTPTVPITTTTIPTPIIPSTPTLPSTSENTLARTGVNSTLTHESTEEDDSSNGGSNAGFSNAIVFGVIGGGGVVLIAVVCGFCMGMKYSSSNKQEQGEDEKDANVQIALVPRTQSEGSGQQYNGSGNPMHGSKWVVSTEAEHTTEGRMSDADSDAVSSRDLSSEMMYMDMPKDYTPGGHLPQAPEGCQRQVEGGAYGTR